MESRWRKSESDTAVKIRKVFEHLKHGKVKKDQLLIVFLVGILLLVISIPAGTKKDSNTGTKKTLANSSKSSVGTTKQSEYTAYMEERLERILSQIDGAGQVQVMITWKSDGEKVVVGNEKREVIFEKTGNVNIRKMCPSRTVREAAGQRAAMIHRRRQSIIVEAALPVYRSLMSARSFPLKHKV